MGHTYCNLFIFTFDGGPRISKQCVKTYFIVPVSGMCFGIDGFFLGVSFKIDKEYILSVTFSRFNKEIKSSTSTSSFEGIIPIVSPGLKE